MLNLGIGSWPARRARIDPEGLALVLGETELTYGQLTARVYRLARRLRAAGVGTGSRVAYLGTNHHALIETLFAAASIGAVFVPLNTRLAAPELAYILTDAEPDVVVWGPEMADVLPAVRAESKATFVVVGGDPLLDSVPYEEFLGAGSDRPVDEPVDPKSTCMIQYTSGTSGRPKGVMLTHENITWNTYNMLVDVDVAADEVSLVSAPLFHTAALDELFLPTFIKGGTAILMPRWNPEEALRVIAARRVTWMFGVPAMFLTLIQSPAWPNADLSSVRTLMCGGAPVPEELTRAYQAHGLTFVQGYGLTESAPSGLFLRARQSRAKLGSAGTPCFFTDVRIVDPENRPVPRGVTGEVVIQGPHVMAGYWRNPQATEAVFHEDGWLRTGDAGLADQDGYIYIVDRIKDMFISGGENVYPAEVEQALYENPEIAECGVIGVPDERWGEVGLAVVVRRPGSTLTADAVLDGLDSRLARYKIPKSVVFVDELPHTASGKLSRTTLRADFHMPAADATTVS